jgi:GNAT superfamily N-acetyltransferase
MPLSRAASQPDRRPPSLLIRPATPGDETRWRSLWAGYCEFYGADVPDEVTVATWRRILDHDAPVNAVVAVVEGQIEGFANYVLHEFTWSVHATCLLEDLFVASAARGRGIGRRLIEHVIGMGRREGWARVYWHTRHDNAEARRLYDKFGPADGFVRYTVQLHGPSSEA